ncbi:LysE family translocator [Streptomyces sp. NPDC050433]|uniref:LysE family translocator n=1 Tax=Streptomyces sp. NPDC050433 TaxID=3365615 RepID=UPI00379382CA
MSSDILSASIAFIATATLLTVTPGPDSALVLRTAVRWGGRMAFMTGLGVSVGLTVWGITSAVGVAALLAASPIGFRILQIAGALWLIWLGVHALAASRSKAVSPATKHTQTAEAAPRRSFATGLSTNLLNPKALIFYVSLLPQFIPPNAPAFSMTLLYALTHALLNIVWFGLLSWCVPATRRLINRRRRNQRRHARPQQRAQTWVERLTGLALIFFGLTLASIAI